MKFKAVKNHGKASIKVRRYGGQLDAFKLASYLEPTNLASTEQVFTHKLDITADKFEAAFDIFEKSSVVALLRCGT